MSYTVAWLRAALDQFEVIEDDKKVRVLRVWSVG